MIRSFKDKDTRRFFEGVRVARFQAFADQATRCLTVLDSASLVEAYGPPVPSTADSAEEEGLARTNEAHDRLQRLESHLRRFIDSEMNRAFGADWPRHQLPNNKYDEWKSKKGAAARAGAPSRPLIAYADFTHYVLVICKRDNWEQVFSPFFGRPESVRESFQRLHPIRLDTMHARPITQDDEILLYVEARRLMQRIGTWGHPAPVRRLARSRPPRVCSV